MSIVNVLKKAASNEEQSELFQASLRLKDPLGIPAIFISTKEKPAQTKFLWKYLRRKFATFINERELEIDIGSAANAMASASTKYLMSSSSEAFRIGWRGADEKNSLSVVFLPHAEMNNSILKKRALGNVQEALTAFVPGTAEQHSFMTTWHEIAHGLSSSEPNAELIAAVMYCRNIADRTFLKARSDIRVVKALSEYRDGEQINSYGWPLIDVLDWAASQETSFFDNLSEDDIKQLANIRFDFKYDEIYAVGALIRNALEDVAEEHDGFSSFSISDYERASRLLKDSGYLKSNTIQKRIIDRFHLAVTRLSNGDYEHNNFLQNNEGNPYYSFPDKFLSFFPH